MINNPIPHYFRKPYNDNDYNHSIHLYCSHCLSDKISKPDGNMLTINESIPVKGILTCFNCNFKGTFKDFELLTLIERNEKILVINRRNKIKKIKNKYEKEH